MIMTVATKIKKVKTHPGLVIVVGDKGDIYIINIYTMTLLKHDNTTNFKGAVFCLYKNNSFVLSGK